MKKGKFFHSKINCNDNRKRLVVMIFDSIDNFTKYLSVNKNFKLVPEFLLQYQLNKLETGKYELPDGNYAIVSSYSTKQLPECFIECHRKYIDVQIIISGIEKVGICNINECEENEYNSEKDFSVLKGNTDFITFRKGHFIVFFPQDGHMPGISCSDTPEAVEKIVFKIVV
jgi:YhcH/YjgK/YiaL family protein